MTEGDTYGDTLGRTLDVEPEGSFRDVMVLPKGDEP